MDRLPFHAVVLAILFAVAGCAASPSSLSDQAVITSVRTDQDPERSRAIPSLVSRLSQLEPPLPLAVVSHGYGAAPEDYGFMVDALVRRGYVVASIDHEIDGDAPLPSTGNVRRDRSPSWQASVRSIRFVRDALVREGVANEAPIVLVGHSHGGDASMMMATEYPSEVAVVFSLDNRRYPLARKASPRVCSLRSSDQTADPGVLPDEAETRRLGIQIIVDGDLRHDDMSDVATPAQKARMLAALAACLDASDRLAGS